MFLLQNASSPVEANLHLSYAEQQELNNAVASIADIEGMDSPIGKFDA